MSVRNDLILADGITNLSFSAGAFRFNLAAIRPDAQPSKEPGKVSAETQACVVMTPQAFMQTFKAMENFLKVVEDKGIIKINEHSNRDINADETLQ